MEHISINRVALVVSRLCCLASLTHSNEMQSSPGNMLPPVSQCPHISKYFPHFNRLLTFTHRSGRISLSLYSINAYLYPDWGSGEPHVFSTCFLPSNMPSNAEAPPHMRVCAESVLYYKTEGARVWALHIEYTYGLESIMHANVVRCVDGRGIIGCPKPHFCGVTERIKLSAQCAPHI